MIKTIGFVGLGNFGAFLMERVQEEAPWIGVCGWDLHKDSPNSLEQVLECDAVVFAVPPKHYISTMSECIPQMRPDGIIVDVCTVKVRTVEALREIAGDRRYLAVHPMFGRQSFIDQGFSLKDLQVVVCEHNIPPDAYLKFENFLMGRLRLHVVHMSPEEHDEIQAKEQLITQYIGCVVSLAGFALNPRNIHTVSARHFYRAMTIVGNDQELFKQASALNPFWPKVLAEYELAEAQHRLELLNGKKS